MSLVNGRQVRFGGLYNSLRDYAKKIIVKVAPFLEAQNVAVANANFVAVGSILVGKTAAVGTGTIVDEGVVAAHVASVAAGDASAVVQDQLGNITNMVRIRDASTHDPLSVGDREIFALVQTSLDDGGTIAGAPTNNTILSFVYVASDGTLTLTNVNKTIEFQVNYAFTNENSPAYEFQGGSATPDIIAPTPVSQKLVQYIVTADFAAGEVINLVTGAGSITGAATPSGDTATVNTTGITAGDNQTEVYENGVKQVKGTDFIFDTNKSGHFAIPLDTGDVFEIDFFAL